MNDISAHFTIIRGMNMAMQTVTLGELQEDLGCKIQKRSKGENKRFLKKLDRSKMVISVLRMVHRYQNNLIYLA